MYLIDVSLGMTKLETDLTYTVSSGGKDEFFGSIEGMKITLQFNEMYRVQNNVETIKVGEVQQGDGMITFTDGDVSYIYKIEDERRELVTLTRNNKTIRLWN